MTLKQWIKNGYDYKLKSAIRLMRSDKRDTSKKIIEILPENVIYKVV